jgi:hypothetical protein
MKFGSRKYSKVWLAALFLCLLGILVLVYLGYRYQGHVSSAFGWISEETGGKKMAVLAIALTLSGLIYGFFCLIAPIIVVLGLRDLRRRTAEMEKTVQTFATLLKSPANAGAIRAEPEQHRASKGGHEI